MLHRIRMNSSFGLRTLLFSCLLTMVCSQLWEHTLGIGKFGSAQKISDGNDDHKQKYYGIFVPYENYKMQRYMGNPIQTKRGNKWFMNFAFRNPTLIGRHMPDLSHLIIKEKSREDINQLKMKQALELDNPKMRQVLKFLTRVV